MRILQVLFQLHLVNYSEETTSLRTYDHNSLDSGTYFEMELNMGPD